MFVFKGGEPYATPTFETGESKLTDRELLERAAKAAGYVGFKDSAFVPNSCVVKTGEDEWSLWRPLTDDGDALRLAVKLNLSIQSYPSWDRAQAWHPGKPDSAPEVPHNGDPYAATRRAIVRAAAEIQGEK